MPNRYKNTKIHFNSGKRSLKTTINPNIGTDISDVVIVSRYGDRLDLLAYEHYGKESDWWMIAEANGLGKGTLHIPAGMQVRIPKKIEKIEEKMEKISKER